jgi:hypothetical protein
MKIVKIAFSLFLLAIMSMALLTPAAEAKITSIRPYFTPYHYFKPKKDKSQQELIKIPKITNIVKKSK